jgi:hypothetical protein
MTPSRPRFEAIAADFGITLPDAHLDAAVEDHARLRPQVERLREAPLSYLDLVEPATAIQWIAEGGRLPPRDRVWDG